MHARRQMEFPREGASLAASAGPDDLYSVMGYRTELDNSNGRHRRLLSRNDNLYSWNGDRSGGDFQGRLKCLAEDGIVFGRRQRVPDNNYSAMSNHKELSDSMRSTDGFSGERRFRGLEGES